MSKDPLQVAVGCLQQLVQPVHQLHIGIATQLAEGGRTFDCLEQRGVESAKQRLTRDIHPMPFLLF
ncbi:hypothetical protein D9M70_519000 [compost metagenome]